MTPLDLAIAELVRVVTAAEVRKKLPVFGHETWGSLKPSEAEALLEELKNLGAKVKCLEAEVTGLKKQLEPNDLENSKGESK